MNRAAIYFFMAFSVMCVSAPAVAQSDLDRAKNLATCLDGRYPILCKKAMLSTDELKKVETAERRENLKTCLTGRYPILCNKGKLTSEEAVQVMAAERSENLQTCLTGRYKVLCKKSLLTESEGQQVIAAERAENLRTCLTGRYQSLCEKSLLTQEQLAQTRAAEATMVKTSKQAVTNTGGTRNRRFSPSSCESGHWVTSVSSNGQIVKLEDGSIWEVDSVDAIDSALWLPTTDIVACDDKLINTDDNETVSASRLR